MNLVRGLQAFVRIFRVEMRPIARDFAKILLWGFAALVGLVLLGFVISAMQAHWHVIAALVAPIAILAEWVGGHWSGLGLEGRLVFYGLFLLWMLSKILDAHFQEMHRRLSVLADLLRGRGDDLSAP